MCVAAWRAQDVAIPRIASDTRRGLIGASARRRTIDRSCRTALEHRRPAGPASRRCLAAWSGNQAQAFDRVRGQRHAFRIKLCLQSAAEQFDQQSLLSSSVGE